MKKSEKNLIHVLDLKNESIKAMNNYQLCMFINDIIANENSIANFKDLINKRFLFLPDQQSAFHVVSKAV